MSEQPPGTPGEPGATPPPPPPPLHPVNTTAAANPITSVDASGLKHF